MGDLGRDQGRLKGRPRKTKGEIRGDQRRLKGRPRESKKET